MRLFQNSGLYPSYRRRLDRIAARCTSFAARRAVFLADRFGAPHFLEPVLTEDPRAFLTNGDDEVIQRLWASEKGMARATSMADILLAQIEEHRAEVFYNLDPVRYGSAFLARLPACVKHRIAWRAAPSPRQDFGGYDLLVCNFPSILESYRKAGWRAAYFAPGHDPEMDAYADSADRAIDVVFVGGYSRHHRRRALVLEAVARLRHRRVVALHLDASRLTRVAESAIGRLLPLAEHRRPADIRAVAREPVFGRDLYRALSSARIVLNGAVDLAGEDRGNMRCFEALGCGALMISDAGRYPQGMRDGVTMKTYDEPNTAVAAIESMLEDDSGRREIARRGHELVRHHYSKARQWAVFQSLVGGLS